MKKILEQALAGKDGPKAKSGRPRKAMNRGGTPARQKESRRLAEEKEAKKVTDSAEVSELERLSDLDSEVGKGKRGQYLRLWLPSKNHHVRYHQTKTVATCQIVNSSFSPVTTT